MWSRSAFQEPLLSLQNLTSEQSPMYAAVGCRIRHQFCNCSASLSRSATLLSLRTLPSIRKKQILPALTGSKTGGPGTRMLSPSHHHDCKECCAQTLKKYVTCPTVSTSLKPTCVPLLGANLNSLLSWLIANLE
jgi:hypothetical protein